MTETHYSTRTIITDNDDIINILEAYCIGKGRLWGIFYGFRQCQYVNRKSILTYKIPNKKHFKYFRVLCGEIEQKQLTNH